MARAPRATPIPIPAFAPAESEDDEEGVVDGEEDACVGCEELDEAEGVAVDAPRVNAKVTAFE
jgi:hypothetical protein